jgi:hypothetical protein
MPLVLQDRRRCNLLSVRRRRSRIVCGPITGKGVLLVTMKIETTSDGRSVILRLIGRIESMYLDELQAEVRRHRPLVLDLDQVTLVDQSVVRFLIACEADGIELVHCAPYIREWMSKDRRREE